MESLETQYRDVPDFVIICAYNVKFICNVFINNKTWGKFDENVKDF